MSHPALASGLHYLRRVVATQHYHQDSDEQLLHAFATQRDEAAFALLVRRHGPMVLHVCRRVLGHEQDAEDIFQAAFLVLAQNAATLRKKTALASFLHGTAYRLALSAKRSAARRRKHESQASAHCCINPADDLSWREVRTLLDEEIARLPEKYRGVFILCCLEEQSRDEAARRLGLKEGTVSSRLAAARQRLQRRLSRRGVELTTVLSASLVAAQPASALPSVLVSSTLRAASATAMGQGTAGLVSAHVAGLVKSASATVSLSKIAMALAVAAAVVAVGAGITARREQPIPQADPPRAEAPKAAAEKPADTVTVRGRVLDPGGKPIKDARLYWPRLRTPQPRTEEDIEYPERAKTDAEGRFRFEMSRPKADLEARMSLVALADGYGADWTNLPTSASPTELTLRLVKDVPIEGRIVSTEGKPLAGIRVGIVSLSTTADGKFDSFLTAWKSQWRMASQQTPKRLFVPMNKVLPTTTTDKDGRFHLGGGGVGRIAVLEVRGDAISQGSLWVIGQDGFDPTKINQSVQDRSPVEMRRLQAPPTLYGPKLTYVAEPSRRMEGHVREAGSGKPVAGYVIHCVGGYNNSRYAVTDKEGRYQIDGLPKMKQYGLFAEPPANSPWLRAGARAEDKVGLQSIAVDFTVARGVLVSGRILDRTTGKGVPAGIRFVPLPGNPFAGKPGYDSFKYESLSNEVGADGRFKLPVMPGLGVLTVQAEGREKANGGQQVNPYKQAQFDAKDRENIKITENDGESYFTAFNGRPESMTYLNAVKMLDLAADAGTAQCDLFVERGATRSVQIEDADGKPLTGATVAGATASGWDMSPIPDARCTIFALDPKKPRRVVFFHAERKLAATLTLRGDEKEPVVARLGPAGAVTGRVLDREGQPIAGADINLDSPDRIAGGLYWQLRPRQRAIRTDKDGRFRREGIVPEVKFSVSIVQGRTYFVAEPRIGLKQVKPGETLDLGDVRVKPGP